MRSDPVVKNAQAELRTTSGIWTSLREVIVVPLMGAIFVADIPATLAILFVALIGGGHDVGSAGLALVMVIGLSAAWGAAIAGAQWTKGPWMLRLLLVATPALLAFMMSKLPNEIPQ